MTLMENMNNSNKERMDWEWESVNKDIKRITKKNRKTKIRGKEGYEFRLKHVAKETRNSIPKQ